MIARPHRLFTGIARGAALLSLLGALSACNSGEQIREAAAVNEFHRQLEQGRIDQIYARSSEDLRGQLSEAQFRRFLSETKGLGRLEGSTRAHYTRTQVSGERDLVVAFYNTRYAKASCLESFTWRVEGNGLKLASYSCARDMQVSCAAAAGSTCETSPAPIPALGLASLP